jgi:hypothetical protein
MLARLVDRVAGAFAVVVLATTPLYFLQARTMLGDVVTMAALAMATSGLALVCFDRVPPAARAFYWLLGILGLAAGTGARGVLVGVAMPALAVGLTWLLTRRRGEGLGATVSSAITLAVGVGGLALGAYVLLKASPEHFSRLLGSSVDPPKKLPTHDFVIHHLGHALFPWSAVVPFAMGRVLAPPLETNVDQALRDTRARIVSGLAAALGLGVYGFLAQRVGLIAFGGVFALAALVGIAARDLERGAPGSRALAIGVGALAILLYTDFKNFPEKGLSAYAVEGAKFPDSFKETATKIIKYGSVGMSALFFGAVMDDAGRRTRPFQRRDYAAWWRTFRTALEGNIQFSAIVIEGLLVAFMLLRILSDAHFHWKAFETLAPPAKLVARYGWAAFPLIVVAPWAATALRDTVRLAFRWVPVTHASVAVASVAAFGATLSLWYYPALAAQISPKGVFSAYRDRAGPGDELAMVGASTGSASYYAGRQVESFKTAALAFTWLVSPTKARRWVVARAPDLPTLNASYRERFHHNLPVLDASSSEILLVSSRLEPGEENQNPLDPWVLDERPRVQHPLDIDFAGQIHAIGWAITAPDGEPVDFVHAGQPYQARLYYEVTRPVVGQWKTFIHIDGFQKRYNGDHDTLQGKYDMRYWRKGDYIVDIEDFELEPNFTAGKYEMFFGFFSGSRRLDVKRGAHHDNRVRAGVVEVR